MGSLSACFDVRAESNAALANLSTFLAATAQRGFLYRVGLVRFLPSGYIIHDLEIKRFDLATGRVFACQMQNTHRFSHTTNILSLVQLAQILLNQFTYKRLGCKFLASLGGEVIVRIHVASKLASAVPSDCGRVGTGVFRCAVADNDSVVTISETLRPFAGLKF